MSISSFLTKKFLKSLFFPAHNRGAALPKKLVKLLKKQPGYWDLPELPEIGSPLSQSGVIAKTQREFSEKYGAKGCFFGVNGASGLIQSAVIAMANPGETILMPRNVHISVIKICAMQNIQPIFFDLDFSSENGHYKPITKKWLKNVFKKINFKFNKNIFVEAESANIGKCKIPYEFFNQMKHSRRIEILRSESNRLDELIDTYSVFKKEELKDSVQRIKKRLGPQRTKIALEAIDKEKWDLVCKSVLDYYDRCYEYEKVGKENITLLDLTDKKYDERILELINNVL